MSRERNFDIRSPFGAHDSLLERYRRGDSFWRLNMPSAIIEHLDLKKPSFRPSKWPRKLKPAKNSKLPKLPENYFEPIGKGGWPPISTWINPPSLGSNFLHCVEFPGEREKRLLDLHLDELLVLLETSRCSVCGSMSRTC